MLTTRKQRGGAMMRPGLFGYFATMYPSCRVYKHERNEEFLALKQKIESKVREGTNVASINFINYYRPLSKSPQFVWGLAVVFHFWEAPFKIAPSVLIAWERPTKEEHDQMVSALIERLKAWEVPQPSEDNYALYEKVVVTELVAVLRKKQNS